MNREAITISLIVTFLSPSPLASLVISFVDQWPVDLHHCGGLFVKPLLVVGCHNLCCSSNVSVFFFGWCWIMSIVLFAECTWRWDGFENFLGRLACINPGSRFYSKWKQSKTHKEKLQYFEIWFRPWQVSCMSSHYMLHIYCNLICFWKEKNFLSNERA